MMMWLFILGWLICAVVGYVFLQYGMKIEQVSPVKKIVAVVLYIFGLPLFSVGLTGVIVEFLQVLWTFGV